MHARYESRSEKVSSSSHDLGRADSSFDTLSATGNTYRSVMSPRVINVSRSRSAGLGGGGSGGGVMTRVFQSYQSSGGSGGFGPGLASLANTSGISVRGGAGGSSTALVGFNVTRHRDKRDLVQLNDKFAQYIEKVRFLEAQNRKLVLELEALRGRSGQGSSRMKEMYSIEMTEATRLIEIAKRDAQAANALTVQAEQEVKRQRARYAEITGLRVTDREEIELIERKVAENDAQIALFRRRIGDLEDEARRYKAESQRISSEIGRLQSEIQNEMFLKSSCDTEKIALEDELSSLRHIHEADLAELRASSVSTDLDPSHFFRNELALAIREIRGDFEATVESQRSEMHNRYSLLYNELIIRGSRTDSNVVSETQRRQEESYRSELLQSQNQNGYIRAKVQDCKNRIDDLQRKLTVIREENSLRQAKWSKTIEEAQHRLARAESDYIEVTSLKTSLEKEISTYRDLLESQNGLRGYVDRIVQSAEQQQIIERSGSTARIVGTGGTGGSTTISRTYISSTGGYGGSVAASGIGNLVATSGTSNLISASGGGGGSSSLYAQGGRSASSSYQTSSSGVSSVYRSSAVTESQSRRSGEH